MKCPLDVDVDLAMSERQGVEIDYCPTCRGVWLDRGELDKILDRAAEQGPAGAVTAGQGAGQTGQTGQTGGHAAGHVSGEGGQGAGFEPIPGTPGYDLGSYGTPGYTSGRAASGGGYGGYERDDDDRRRYDDDRSRYERPGYDPRRKKRKESWLGDLLDFG